MLYIVTVTVHRNTEIEPAGVFEVDVTAEYQAASWEDAVAQATDEILDNLLPLTGSLIGCTITSVQARAA